MLTNPPATRLYDVRKKHNLTQLTLARRSGVQAPHISMIENGLRNPTPVTLQKLALALKCDPNELLADEPNGNGAHG